MGYRIQPNAKNLLPLVDYVQVEKCRKEAPIAELDTDCNKLGAYCRVKGFIDSSTIEATCIIPFVSPKLFNYSQLRQGKYLGLDQKYRDYSAACLPIFETCQSVSNSSDWWAFTACYRTLLLGYRNQPNTSTIFHLPIIQL